MKLSSCHVLHVLAASAAARSRSVSERATTGPFLEKLDDETWVIGNEIWNMTQQVTYGVKLYYQDHDCVGDAVGHYVSYDGALSNLNWTDASVASRGTYNATDWIDVVFTAEEGYMHWVIFSGLPGAYQYFVNKALPNLGEFRTLWRLDNETFTHGHNDVRDEPLPPLSDFVSASKVQDETWLAPDGAGDSQGYITKYDFAAFLRNQTAYGVYGPGFGSWYINPGKDDYNGNHLKQELTVHRESTTGDAVMLNMLHGTHFMASSNDSFAVGRTWGPWLWYLNDGSVEDAEARAGLESAAWPYAWFEDEAYQSRGGVAGQLVLSDGRPAAHAAVFLGDDDPSSQTALDMGSRHYYATHADGEGRFAFAQVRAPAAYGLQAWPGEGGGGGALAGVTTSLRRGGVRVAAGATADLGRLAWAVPAGRARLFRVGDVDRLARGFRHGGAPRAHGLADACPADLTYAAGRDGDGAWCFAQSRPGNWTVEFEVPDGQGERGGEATLIVSLAAYSTGTDAVVYANGDTVVGNLTGGTALLANDPSLYRSATLAGEWRYLEFSFDAGVLHAGTNTITFAVTKSTQWRGIMWDSIVLEW